MPYDECLAPHLGRQVFTGTNQHTDTVPRDLTRCPRRHMARTILAEYRPHGGLDELPDHVAPASHPASPSVPRPSCSGGGTTALSPVARHRVNAGACRMSRQLKVLTHGSVRAAPWPSSGTRPRCTSHLTAFRDSIRGTHALTPCPDSPDMPGAVVQPRTPPGPPTFHWKVNQMSHVLVYGKPPRVLESPRRSGARDFDSRREPVRIRHIPLSIMGSAATVMDTSQPFLDMRQLC